MRMLFLAVALLVTEPAFAESLRAGDPFPALQLSDQHDTAVHISAQVQVVLFSHDMDGAGLLEDTLGNDGQNTLNKARAIVLSDISRMPSLVTTLFALPAMRRRSYRMILDRDGSATAAIPRADDAVTVIRITEGKISDIEFADGPEELQAIFSAATNVGASR